MFKLVGISACILALVGLTGCSESAPVEVTLRQNPLWEHSLIIEVSSKVDQVKVNSVVVNRGNCRSSGSASQIKFGQNASFSTSTACDVKEIEVDTDDGSFTFTF